MKKDRWIVRTCMLAACAAAVCSAAGCAGVSRSAHDSAYLMQRREENESQFHTMMRRCFSALLLRTKAEVDDFAAGRRPDPPVIEILIISGGGDWGAFGAGVLKGWSRIPRSDPMTLPQFDAVTGVSTGALIAPFAFIGDDESIDQLEHLYRNPKDDWVKDRGLLFFLPHNISFAEVPGLERDLKANVNLDMARRIVDAGSDGRLLAVNTTNLDDASPYVFQLVDEARHALDIQDTSRLHDIMLASAGLPGALPYREIDGIMYVDGGVTANIIYGGRVGEEDTLPAMWQEHFPDVQCPRIRYWVIFNNKMQAMPDVVQGRWPAIVKRSLEVSVRASTLVAIRHLHAIAEVLRLKHHTDIEVRVMSIPTEWMPPVEGDFKKETMNDLVELGIRMGENPANWSKDIPPY